MHLKINGITIGNRALDMNGLLKQIPQRLVVLIKIPCKSPQKYKYLINKRIKTLNCKTKCQKLYPTK